MGCCCSGRVVSPPCAGRTVLHCPCTFSPHPAQLTVGFPPSVLFINTLYQLHFLYIDFYVWGEQHPCSFFVLTSFYCSLTFISWQPDCHGVPSLIDVLLFHTARACPMPAAYFQFMWRYSLFFFPLTSMTLFVLLQKEG